MTNLYKMIRHSILYYYSIKKIALQFFTDEKLKRSGNNQNFGYGKMFLVILMLYLLSDSYNIKDDSIFINIDTSLYR